MIDETKESDKLTLIKVFLNEKGTSLLLFLDNANQMNKEEIDWIRSIKCKIIITSRTKYEPFRNIDIGILEPKDALYIYKKHSKTTSDEYDETINEIIEIAGRHTLTVELLAKTQSAGGYKAYEILKMLKEDGFSLDKISDEVSVEGSTEYDHMYKILEKVFDITVIKDDEQLKILTLFSLLADNISISKRKLKGWFETTNNNALNKLVRYGWLTEDEDEEGNVFIHPVIAEIVRNKEKPDFSYAEGMINKIVEELDKTNLVNEKSELLIHCTAIEKGIKKEESEETAWFQHEIGYGYHHIASYSKALEYFNKAKEIREKVLGEEHLDTATTYNDIALVYADLRKYDKALKYYYKAKEIRKKN